MRFYVVYKYCRGGRFDHDYHTYCDKFETLDDAVSYIDSIKGRHGYMDIIGPLFLARSLELEDEENDEV